MAIPIKITTHHKHAGETDQGKTNAVVLIDTVHFNYGLQPAGKFYPAGSMSKAAIASQTTVVCRQVKNTFLYETPPTVEKAYTAGP